MKSYGTFDVPLPPFPLLSIYIFFFRGKRDEVGFIDLVPLSFFVFFPPFSSLLILELKSCSYFNFFLFSNFIACKRGLKSLFKRPGKIFAFVGSRTTYLHISFIFRFFFLFFLFFNCCWFSFFFSFNNLKITDTFHLIFFSFFQALKALFPFLSFSSP